VWFSLGALPIAQGGQEAGEGTADPLQLRITEGVSSLMDRVSGVIPGERSFQ
jgi:hypothetical protein